VLREGSNLPLGRTETPDQENRTMHVNHAGGSSPQNLAALRGTQAPPRAKPAPPPAAKADADGDHDGDKGKNVDAKA